MEPHYRVVFRGELLPDREIEEVIAAFSSRFKVKPQTAREVISTQGRQVLKRKLQAERAEHYRAAFRKVGLVVEIEQVAPASELGWAGGTGSKGQPEPPGPLAAAGETLMLASREVSRDIYAEMKMSPDQGTKQPPDADSDAVARSGERQIESAPVEGAGKDETRTRCPKCGAVAVSPVDGTCEACGVVAERYLARLAAEGGDGAGASDNPYATPRAELQASDDGMSDEFTGDPRGVGAERGWGWISDGWEMFKVQPVAWVSAVLLLLAINVVLGLIPWVGSVISSFVGPILTAGLIMGAHVQYEGQRFKVVHLFAGFFHRSKQLALLGLAYLGAFFALGIVTGLVMVAVVAAAGGGSSLEGFDPASLGIQSGDGSLPLVALSVLVALALSLPLVMAMLFAPALVALDDVPIFRAFKLSFIGCWRNILPFLVYGLVALALLILGALPMMLGLLLVVPVLTIAVYIAYRDIYYL